MHGMGREIVIHLLEDRILSSLQTNHMHAYSHCILLLCIHHLCYHWFFFFHFSRSGSRVGSSVISSMVPPYPGNSRAHSHASHGLHVYHQSNSSGVRAPIPSSIRRLGTRGLAPVGPTSSSSDHSSLYVFPPSGRSHQDVEGSGGNRFVAWERDCLTPFPLVAVDREAGWWGPFASGSDAGSRTGGIWHRHGSDRPSSQGWAESTSYQPVHHHTRMHPFMWNMAPNW